MGRLSLVLLVLVLGVVVVTHLPYRESLQSFANYLPVHTVLELLAIGIALLVFAVGFNTFRRGLPANILLMSCGFLGVGILDTSHMLSYHGMPDFVTPNGVEKAINFWLAARTLAALVLFVVASTAWRPATAHAYRYVALVPVLLLMAGLHWLLLFHDQWLPRTFIDGHGLTPFKVYYEYGLVALNLATALVLLARMRGVLNFNAPMLFGAVCSMALSEFLFTLYSDVGDIYNFLGHIYKSISYLFLYRAIFVETIEYPFSLLQGAERQLQFITDHAPVHIAQCDKEYRYRFVNQSYAGLFGLQPEDLVGKTAAQIMDRDSCAQARPDMAAALAGSAVSSDMILRSKTGPRVYLAHYVPERSATGEVVGFISAISDITARKEAEARIESLAHFDQLTGLPNRSLLKDRFDYVLGMAHRNGEPLAVMFLDLDHFKKINDTLGHGAGDEVLIEVARRLKARLREADIVSRLGGDEFIVVLPDTDEEGAIHVALSLIEAFSPSCNIDDQELLVTPSIGIALYPHDGEDFDTLSRNADAAMYRVKQSGRNGYSFYAPEMQAQSVRYLQLAGALRQALQRDELQLHYQPQLSIRDGRVVGAEALLRWRHPEWGMVSPAEFIPIAEESGLITPIGEWVIRTAVRQMKAWRARGLPEMPVAVNLSAVQFRQENITELITRILDEEGLPYHLLELELTEAVAMDDAQRAVRIMDSLHEQGIRMSIDDFGTGYSSLSYLKKFKVSKLKIDQSFVRDLDEDPEDKTIVGTIIHMAASLGMKTIAEGVETASQLAFLRLHGCDEVQGFYFSKPLPAGQFEAFARSNGSDTTPRLSEETVQ
ncbi:EAL domain-containing protein [Marinobacterium aestuariivivens]|uniref:EAL domain-containing protein n=1 Tax=Marinobacterium aestuariivivens TaxID=1698799 RepID=A0ABW2A545_9GAMM